MKIDIILGAGYSATEVTELGDLADSYGLNTFWNQSFPSRREPLLMMAGLTRSTQSIRLGTLPVSPYEVHPLRLADSLLTFLHAERHIKFHKFLQPINHSDDQWCHLP